VYLFVHVYKTIGITHVYDGKEGASHYINVFETD
jgi:hypothetical protein